MAQGRLDGGAGPSRRMRRRLPYARRIATVARWPLGILLTSWRYMWRITPIHRLEQDGSLEGDFPPEIPAAADTADLQLAADGSGPLFHRTFQITLANSKLSPAELMRRIQADPNAVAPGEFVHFGKVSGSRDRMAPGDEFIVRMPGPWDGPVRVLEADELSFRMATLAGHLEAGQIRFRAWQEGGRLCFRIDTWARSGDRLSDLLYDRLRFAKEVQLHMWTSFLEGVGRVSGGRRDERLQVVTRRLDQPGTERVASEQSRQLEAARAA